VQHCLLQEYPRPWDHSLRGLATYSPFLLFTSPGSLRPPISLASRRIAEKKYIRETFHHKLIEKGKQVIAKGNLVQMREGEIHSDE